MSLAAHDPDLFALIKAEEARQRNCIELIASEVRGSLPSPSTHMHTHILLDARVWRCARMRAAERMHRGGPC